MVADLVLTNARIHDGAGWSVTADSIAVRAGRIVAIGSDLPAGAEVVDLGGAWVLPGFHDAHVHPVQAGLEMNACDLTGGGDVDGYLDRIAAYATSRPEAEWVLGGGWSMDAFPGGVPTAAALDHVLPDRPAFLPNRDHHSAWVNTAALRRAGIDRTTPDPSDGRIERDVDGEPTGALHEGAMELVRALVPPPTPAEQTRALLSAQAYLHSWGIVGWQDALVGTGLGMADSLDTYLAAARDGSLTAKVVTALWWDRARGAEQIPELLDRRARAAAAGIDAGSVKIMQDGVCETFTAAVIDPYLDGHGRPTANHGLSFIERADLASYVQQLDAADFQVHVHALGDRAVRDSLDAIEHAAAVNGRRGNRHHLAHVQIVHPDDVPRFAALDVTANAQPLWACLDEQMADLTLPFLGTAAKEQQYVFRSLLASGARLAFGSDWPVSSPDPFGAMHVAVNRRSPGSDRAALLADQGLTVAEALQAYTEGSAWVNRLEDVSGRIAVGAAADLAVVDHDVLAVPVEQIGDVRVLRTYVDGRCVHGD
ncbi:amidohydrolase [Aeromicrobium chenweiae]|uniref:Amidohydrolase n=1 Tax=Aeromicrobium chenweiae TaxID=2079793 RepID=A0A2S0WIN6_9ACTN|nr:amidohydrolase [Aeromicrobium chenweiae]AWB91144.1 amidohydrolase [Aeromicrobium chenweiae]TGN31664.1 amidohydrolase [Aeromicrobium chenweiae]